MSTFHCNSCGRDLFRSEHILSKRSIWEQHSYQAECYVVSEILHPETLRRYDDTAHQGLYCCHFIARRMTVDKYGTGDAFLVYTDSVTEIHEGDPLPKQTSKHTGMIRLTERDFDEVVQGADPNMLLVVKMGALWCPPCRLMDAMFARIHAIGGLPQVSIFEVDVEEEPRLRARWNFRSIPLTLFFRSGQQLDISGLGHSTVCGGLNGAISDAAFRSLCQTLLAQPPNETSLRES
jgi:thiol-disulfide isomerase/thioredoxin